MRAERFAENPIVRPNMDARMGTNVNGPSLIRVPDWVAEPLEVLAPELPYEGGDLPRLPSVRGLVDQPVCQLRDPAIFEEADRAYLLYSVAGEHGIAIAELRP